LSLLGTGNGDRSYFVSCRSNSRDQGQRTVVNHGVVGGLQA